MMPLGAAEDCAEIQYSTMPPLVVPLAESTYMKGVAPDHSAESMALTSTKI